MYSIFPTNAITFFMPVSFAAKAAKIFFSVSPVKDKKASIYSRFSFIKNSKSVPLPFKTMILGIAAAISSHLVRSSSINLILYFFAKCLAVTKAIGPPP